MKRKNNNSDKQSVFKSTFFRIFFLLPSILEIIISLPSVGNELSFGSVLFIDFVLIVIWFIISFIVSLIILSKLKIVYKVILLFLFIFWPCIVIAIFGIKDRIYIEQHGGEVYILYCNTGISLPRPDTDEEIFYSIDKEGEAILVWQYNDDDFETVTWNNAFTKIADENKEEIENLFLEFEERICDEKDKQSYYENIDIDYLNNENNYYAFYRKDDNSIWFLLADSENKKLYVFESII